MPGHRNAKKRSKGHHEPSVRYLRYELDNSGTPGNEVSHFVDLAKDLSALNRRLYRQGKYYYVKKITCQSRNTDNPPAGASISVSTCPDSWVAQKAWQRGFRTWTQMNKEAKGQTSGIMQGTWADFKVYLSDDMRTGSVLEPRDNGGNNPSTTNAEWIYAKLVTSEGTATDDEFFLHMLGDHVGSSGSRTTVGLIKSYGESRATVQIESPDTPGDVSQDPLVNVFNYGETIDVVVENMENANDTPPYSATKYPGDDANMPKPLVVQQSTLSDGKAVLGGFRALAGLLEFETVSSIANDTFNILIELAVGDYRGIKAESI